MESTNANVNINQPALADATVAAAAAAAAGPIDDSFDQSFDALETSAIDAPEKNEVTEQALQFERQQAIEQFRAAVAAASVAPGGIVDFRAAVAAAAVAFGGGLPKDSGAGGAAGGAADEDSFNQTFEALNVSVDDAPEKDASFRNAAAHDDDDDLLRVVEVLELLPVQQEARTVGLQQPQPDAANDEETQHLQRENRVLHSELRHLRGDMNELRDHIVRLDAEAEGRDSTIEEQLRHIAHLLAVNQVMRSQLGEYKQRYGDM